MSFSDLILLNSNITKREVITAFPTLALLQQHKPSGIDGTNTGTDNQQQQHLHASSISCHRSKGIHTAKL